MIQDMFEHPDKYPITPVKVPIENPYYVPKPVSLESLNNQKTMSSSTKSTVKVTQKPPAKIFWLKKCFRNPVVNKEDQSTNREAEDLEKWPRKKAVVSFTNGIFIEEIKDLNDKSTSNLANFMHDVTDLYKFISPRQRRGTSM